MNAGFRRQYDLSVKPVCRILPLAAATLLLGGCATVLDQDGALALARYELLENGQIVVDVRVNGQGPFPFAIDTGASISVIHDRVRNRLGLEPEPGESVTIHGALASGVYAILSIDNIDLGGEIWRPLRVASMPGDAPAVRDIDGILGLDFLQRYAVGISAEERVVRLYPPDLIGQRTYRGWASVPLKPEPVGASGATVYMFSVKLGDKRIPALFDLGAGVNLINWPAARRLGLRPEELMDEATFSGAIDTKKDVGWFRIDEVSTGGVRWQNETFSVANLPIFAALVEEDSPCALLGTGLFAQRDFIIDFASSRLLVKITMREIGAEGEEDERHSPRQFPVRDGLPWIFEQH